MTASGEKFANELVARIRIRRTAGGGVCVLDLRHAKFGNRLPRVLRCPQDAGWPMKGRATSDRATAELWVREAYASQLRQELDAAPTREAGARTFEQAAEAYVADKLRVLGPGGLRSINSRVSMLRAHVLPALGKLPLVSITPAIIRESLDEMRVSKSVRPGERVKARPELGTQKNFVRAASAVWRHAYPDQPSPFGHIRLADDKGKAERRRALFEGNFEELLAPKSGAMTPAQFELAMTAALYLDTYVGGRPCTRALMIPNTAHAVALQTALGVRVSEMLNLRWQHINFDKAYVLIAGTKTSNALRVVPLQEQALPWLRDLQRLEGGSPDPRDFVIRTNARNRHNSRGSIGTIVRRMSQALRYAGLKRQKKATHWSRATHATWGAASGSVPIEMLKAYLGHARPFGGATDDYVTVSAELIPKKHRRYIRHLPSPERIQNLLAAFEPAQLPPWQERRRIFSRSKTALEEQRARGRARKPMHARLDPDAEARHATPVGKAFGFGRES